MTSEPLDPRLNAYRTDLAAERLRGRVDAPRYVEGRAHQVIKGATALRRDPRFDAVLETELLFGECVHVFDENEGWAWLQSESDGYVGYASSDALSSDIVAPTHRVSALRTFIFPGPDITMPPLDLLSLNARVSVTGEDGRFVRLSNGGFLRRVHLRPVADAEPDFVAVAERFLGAPYLWGGRTSIGLDCSALIQLSLTAAGVPCPRDADMQEAALGEALSDPADLSRLRRGDLLFWKRHMGVMTDDTRLLHANAHHMETAIEPVAEAVDRIAADKSPVTSIRRLNAQGAQ